MLLLIFLIFCTNCFAQHHFGEVEDFEEVFCYEASPRAVIMDDMVLRSTAIFSCQDKKIKHDEKIFLFETNPPIALEKIKEINWATEDSLNFFSNIAIGENEIRNYLNTIKSASFAQEKIIYKQFKFRFRAVYLGVLSHSFRKGKQICSREIPTYFILRFDDILPCQF